MYELSCLSKRERNYWATHELFSIFCFVSRVGSSARSAAQTHSVIRSCFLCEWLMVARQRRPSVPSIQTLHAAASERCCQNYNNKLRNSLHLKESDWNSKPHKALSLQWWARAEGLARVKPRPTDCVGTMRRLNNSNCPYAKCELVNTNRLSDWLSIHPRVCVCGAECVYTCRYVCCAWM